MLIVIAELTIKPEKKAELFTFAQALITATRAESECISYELLEDPYNAANCMFVERWTDKKALEQHQQTPHISLWRQQSLPLLADKTVIKLYQSEEVPL
ncbi:putative quinol monooxygenase [Anaerospora sp.]|jgi:quinol monooxygenase YgiN|uniref:putative quinol monooxygenase n=1 Tax=Anaerospora sp. TaxID=1960278 RepID=UPI00289D7A56|nr:putative quinol monooxygenase [Anaerospora sp.]